MVHLKMFCQSGQKEFNKALHSENNSLRSLFSGEQGVISTRSYNEAGWFG